MATLRAVVLTAAVFALAACGQSTPSPITEIPEVKAWVAECYENQESCRGDIVFEDGDMAEGSGAVWLFDPDALTDLDWRSLRTGQHFISKVTRVENGPEAYHAAAMRLYRS